MSCRLDGFIRRDVVEQPEQREVVQISLGEIGVGEPIDAAIVQIPTYKNLNSKCGLRIIFAYPKTQFVTDRFVF